MASDVAKALRERAEDHDLLDTGDDVRALADYIEVLRDEVKYWRKADDEFGEPFWDAQRRRAQDRVPVTTKMERAALKALGYPQGERRLG